MTPEDIQTHKMYVIKQIENHLDEIKNEEHPGYFLNISDLLCRVGELESILRWQFDLDRNPDSKPMPNRLCVCY